MKPAKFIISLVIFLVGGVLVARLVVVVAGPLLLQTMATRQLREIGFVGAHVERAWVDFDGVHFVGIALDAADNMTADEALIPMSRELIGGGVGRMIVTGARISGLPRVAAGPAGPSAGWPAFAIELREAQWRPTTSIVVELSVTTQAASADGAARIAATGTARHEAAVPAFAPLQLAAAIVARGDTLAGRVRLTDAGQVIDLRIDGDYRVLSGIGAATVAVAPAALSSRRGIAEIAPALAVAIGERVDPPTGSFEGEARLDWDGKTLLSSGRIALSELSVGRGAGEVRRVSGALDFASLLPAKLAAAQRLDVSGASPGAPGGPLDLDADAVLAIEQTIRAWLGGDPGSDDP